MSATATGSRSIGLKRVAGTFAHSGAWTKPSRFSLITRQKCSQLACCGTISSGLLSRHAAACVFGRCSSLKLFVESIFALNRRLSGKKWSRWMNRAMGANRWSRVFCRVRPCSFYFPRPASHLQKRRYPGAYNSLYRPTTSYNVPMDYMKE